VDKNIEKNKIALTTILNFDNYAIWWKDVEALFVALECEMLLPATLVSKTDPKYVQPNKSQRAAKKIYAIIRNAQKPYFAALTPSCCLPIHLRLLQSWSGW
jgi:hypothetical protein